MGIFSRKKSNNQTAESAQPTSPTLINKKIITKAPAVSALKTAGENHKSKTPKAYRVLLRPIISEKSTIGVSQNKYSFEVFGAVNKVEIKEAVREVYGVSPVRVNIIKRAKQVKRFGRTTGATKAIKKAIVTLKKGDTIKLYEGI